ncbi:hypothetical protein BD324DRAFT_619424 [Kockovaella imperatae]|uniref:Vacuolar protein sorting-associated protein 41 n=1 Tax=Kockovaella imperatae TaxID=4999 RepID=A0A1Y1UMZ3_9TREE|nr:hypothetical protein BD324DRAFT_619424 [Kockovaella imperatae]ORX39372.1 hypothetical protein BD324DRAFT_619424 [Kockovaella imperatae]
MDTSSPGAGPSRSGSTLSSVRSRSPESKSSRSSSRKGKERDSSSSDSESGSESESESDDEPTLKYSRLKGKVPEILARDQASAIAIGRRIIAIGTENGMVQVLTHEGSKVKSYRPHAARITCLRIDEEDEFIATSSFEGRVMIHSLTTPEVFAFDYKRPMNTISLEPGFAKKASRTFVCGGLGGSLIHQEKGWMGWKEQVLHSGEGPIWASEWQGDLIAWANDLGVKIYDTSTSQRIGFIDRGADPPRAELFKCSLLWKDDHTLIIGWADYIKIVRIRSRPRAQTSTGLPALTVELTAIFQVDCMISGISPFGSSYIVLAYIAPDTYDNEATDDPMEQRRKAANRPELRVITAQGEESTADALSLANFHLYGCSNYSLVKSSQIWYVLTPADIIIVQPRDESDHIQWLVERERFEEALEAAEKMSVTGALDAKAIGLQYMHHLSGKGDYARAAALASRVLEDNVGAWETWVDIYTERGQLAVITPYLPTRAPRLEVKTYDAVLNTLLSNDRPAFLSTIKSWPGSIYTSISFQKLVKGEVQADPDPVLIESLAELYIHDAQPAKALPYLLRLGRPEVFDLIKEHNLFASIQDQALSLVEFDQSENKHAAVEMLVDHVHSIPVERVVRQLEPKPEYLYLYLDALFQRDQSLAFPYSDQMVDLYAAHGPERLMLLLRGSNFYDLERAYKICKTHDLVPEMVFLLGRMGNNKEALMLIIQRMGDVQKAIEFAKEQADEDLWEDLLNYSETRPDFIRALLEHVGAEINPIRLIRRIKDGMGIPGLKPALVKILQASNLQVSLMEGCHKILNGDCADLAEELQAAQTGGARASPSEKCAVCGLGAFTQPVTLAYLCRHFVHGTCALLNPDLELPLRTEHPAVNQLLANEKRGAKVRRREVGQKLSLASEIRVKVGRCPVCSTSSGK